MRRREEGTRERLLSKSFLPRTKDASNIEVAVVGKNPGYSTFLERTFYRYLAGENRKCTFKDCQIVWRSIAADHDYYERPRNLLRKLGVNLSGVLWAEAVFCEKDKSSSKRNFPPETFEKCSQNFLKYIIQLVPEGKYIVCLGQEAFEWVGKIESSMNNPHKVISVYHPTGNYPRFSKYFEKYEGNGFELKKGIREEFDKLKGSKKSFIRVLRADSPNDSSFFSVEPWGGRTKGRKSSPVFRSACKICEENGVTRVFVINRADFRKPSDDPRIRHLQEDHGKKDEIRLRNRFKRV